MRGGAVEPHFAARGLGDLEPGLLLVRHADEDEGRKDDQCGMRGAEGHRDPFQGALDVGGRRSHGEQRAAELHEELLQLDGRTLDVLRRLDRPGVEVEPRDAEPQSPSVHRLARPPATKPMTAATATSAAAIEPTSHGFGPTSWSRPGPIAPDDHHASRPSSMPATIPMPRAVRKSQPVPCFARASAILDRSRTAARKPATIGHEHADESEREAAGRDHAEQRQAGERAEVGPDRADRRPRADREAGADQPGGQPDDEIGQQGELSDRERCAAESARLKLFVQADDGAEVAEDEQREDDRCTGDHESGGGRSCAESGSGCGPHAERDRIDPAAHRGCGRGCGRQRCRDRRGRSRASRSLLRAVARPAPLGSLRTDGRETLRGGPRTRDRSEHRAHRRTPAARCPARATAEQVRSWRST